jgi:two-component system cell cycle response regulator
MNTFPQPAPRSAGSIPMVLPLPATAIQQPAVSNRKKIMVVDDSIIILKTLSMKLKAGGYDVLTAEDGAVAVSTARRERPDLILLDLVFPPDVAHGGGVAWDGFLIMDWLKRMEEAKDIPIIIITGSKSEEFKARSMAAGAVGYFQKPLNNDELLAAIHQALGENPVPNQPSAV